MQPDSTSLSDIADRSPEAIRRSHLRRESDIKSVGQLCYLVAFFSALGTLEFALFAVGVLPREEFKDVAPPQLLDLFFGGMAVAFAVNTSAQLALGLGLIRLKAWARWTVIALTLMSLAASTLSSLAVCLGGSALAELEPIVGFKLSGPIIGLSSLIIGGGVHLLILWPLVGSGSGMVFSREYREVIRQTPTIRSRMHWLLKTLIGLILLGVGGFIAYLLAIFWRIID